MASEAPSAFTNVQDAVVRVGRAIYDTALHALVKNSRYLYEMMAPGSESAGEARQIWPHTHGDLAEGIEDGEWIGRTIFNKSFMAGSSDSLSFSVTGGSLEEVLYFRARVGGVQRLAAEVAYKVSANGVKFQIERWDWNDTAADSDDGGLSGTQYLIDSSYQTSTTAQTNHTIDGTSYTSDGAGGYNANNGGADTKLLYLDLGTYAAPDEDRSLAGFRLRVYGSGACTLSLYSLHVLEVKTTDEGGGGVLT